LSPKHYQQMTDNRTRFEKLKVCVIIPTYNNASTLSQVLTDVSAYTNQIILVNDGSTDETENIAMRFLQVHFISYSGNKGKGTALRRAFKAAIDKGYDYAITMDSDGQHFAKDLPQFLDKIETSPGTLIIGARNMNQDAVPGKSSFGYKFSNFWFKVETGIDCPDTQSGFRLYPLQRIKNLNLVTWKYELEIEVLVKAAWRGVPIASVPISVYYAPKETRVSHFRPFVDFTRISILNTFLVIIAFVYIKPRDFLRTMFKKKTLGNFSATSFCSHSNLTRLNRCPLLLAFLWGSFPSGAFNSEPLYSWQC
jgi:glycosyltransferase involved in cell wall biosynthesis